MASFELWDRTTLEQFAREATAKLIENKEAIEELSEALKQMVETFKDTPSAESNSFDEPPEPVSQWDYEAFITIAQASFVLTKHELTTKEQHSA